VADTQTPVPRSVDPMRASRIQRAAAELRDPVRRQVIVGEVLRFAIVGASGFVLDFALFNILIHRDMETIAAKAISTTVAAVLTYVLNRSWSFAHRNTRGHSRDLTVFLALSAVGLGIATACLAISHYWLGFDSRLADNISGIGFGTVLGTLWRFYSFKRWVFTKPGTRNDEVLAAAVL
jgi:putative flippase GtrA